jgi:hypothetical protein
MTAAPRPTARQPWPLWPIAVAIVVSLAGYTYFRLAFAKPDKPHEPFAESRQRSESAKLKAAGWEWSEATYEAVVDLPAPEAAVHGLPVRPAIAEELFRLSTENWHLPIEYTDLAAAPHAPAGTEYAVHFQVELDQARAHIVSYDLYRKGADLIVIPRWEPYPPELVPRRPKTGGRLVVPAAALPAGHYRVTLLALKQSSQWELEVVAP